MKKWFLFLFLPAFSFAQERQYQLITDTLHPRELQIDQLSLDVSVAFDVRNKRVDGYAELAFEPLTQEVDSLWLDGPGIMIDTLNLDGQAVPFKTFPAGLAIFPPEYLELRHKYLLQMHYRAWPKKGLYFVNWGEFNWQRGEPEAPQQIWTQGQGIDNRHWIPHVDAQNDKLLTALTVTFDTGYAVISNGLLKKHEVLGDKAIWRYEMEKPHSSYLIMLAIGHYHSFPQMSYNGTQLWNYYYPDWKERNQYTYYKNREIFDFLEAEIGMLYPWEEYKQVPVMNFQHGAMENTSATIFGDFFCVDSISFNDRNYVGVNAHELAHQWFGNLVTATHSTHHWLHEGFATYYAWLAEEEVFGSEKFALLRKESLERVLAAEERDMFPLAHGQAGSERFYDKGAWVLFMLRNEVGDSAWHVGIKNYLTKYRYDLAQTDFLKKEMEIASGKDLDWFFEQWVYRPQIPILTESIGVDKSGFNVVVKQYLAKNQPAYQLSIPLRIITTKREFFAKMNIDGAEGNYNEKLAEGEKLLAVIPDPNFELLADWQVFAPLFVLENMASSNNSNWYFGGRELVNLSIYNPKFAAKMSSATLINRVAYAEALAKKGNASKTLSEEEVAFLAAQEQIEVVKAFLKYTMDLQPALFPVVEKWLQWPSYELVESALIRLCINDKANAKRYLEKTKDIIGTSGHNVRITWLLLYTAFVSQDKTAELTEYMGPKYDFLTRIKAFEVATQLNYLNYNVANHAFGSLLQGNRKLRNAGRDFIKTISANPKNKEVFQGWMDRNRQLLSPDELKIIEQLTGYKPND